MLYFASGQLDVPGAMFTASHNPAKYNGIKLCRAGAKPVGQDTGLGQLREWVENGVVPGAHDGRACGHRHAARPADRVRRLPAQARRPVGDPPADGRRRRRQRHGWLHRAEGLRRACRSRSSRCTSSSTARSPTTRPTRSTRRTCATCRRRCARSAPIGLAFDGDADRCFVVDERGEIVAPSTVTALIAVRELEREPGSTIIYNLITSKAVPEIVREHGGDPGPHPRRPLVHQGDDGRDRRGLRRRALRPLLLP